MSKIVMSPSYPAFCAALRDRGHEIIPTDRIEIFLKPEQYHADMQLLRMNELIFLLRECEGLSEKLSKYKTVRCENSVGKNYPENAILNFLYLNNKLYGKASAIDNSIREYCLKNCIEIRNVNQGYAGCSTLVVNNKAVVTSDISIEKALKNDGAEVLLISPGHIRLEGFDHGFIGGCSGTIDKKVFFLGNLHDHPDCDRIISFISRHDAEYEILCEDIPLTDIGGIVQINPRSGP